MASPMYRQYLESGLGIPHIRHTLDTQKTALRWDVKKAIKNLCNRLADMGEECYLVTANSTTGWVGHLGSTKGAEYIEEHPNIPWKFLKFCEGFREESEESGTDDDDDSAATYEMPYLGDIMSDRRPEIPQTDHPGSTEKADKHPSSQVEEKSDVMTEEQNSTVLDNEDEVLSLPNYDNPMKTGLDDRKSPSVEEDPSSRFAALDSMELEEDLNDEEKPADNTLRVIKVAINILKAFAASKKLQLSEVEQLGKPELADFLREFYACARNKKGKMYSKKSMICLRYGIQQHFLKVRELDTVSDGDFKPANKMFSVILAKIDKKGKGVVKHKPVLSKEDMDKLYSSPSLSQYNATGLQNRVFVDFMLHFRLRGRDNIRDVLVSDFVERKNAAGQRCIYLVKDKANHESLDEESLNELGKMTELRTNMTRCPYTSFKNYLGRLDPKCQYFFQRPKRNHFFIDPVWYDSLVLGKNSFDEKMKKLSLEAGLSRMYTNQSLRATGLTDWAKAREESRRVVSTYIFLEKCEDSPGVQKSIKSQDVQKSEQIHPVIKSEKREDVQQKSGKFEEKVRSNDMRRPSAPKTTVYHCRCCCKSYRHQSLYVSHLTSAEHKEAVNQKKNVRYLCVRCSKYFPNKSHLMKHKVFCRRSASAEKEKVSEFSFWKPNEPGGTS